MLLLSIVPATASEDSTTTAVLHRIDGEVG
jgi:hypothetical protein